jgi:hypothetical protein
MIKCSFRLVTFLVLLLSSTAHAGLVEYAPGTGIIICDSYLDIQDACIESDNIPDELIVIKDQFEWVWASGVNSELYLNNTLMSPEFHGTQGWRFAKSVDELAELASLQLEDFKNDDGSLIHAALYWNTWLMSVNSDQFVQRRSEWAGSNTSLWTYETFYVRDIPSDVPEPSTIMIFAIALIALSLRKRAIK